MSALEIIFSGVQRIFQIVAADFFFAFDEDGEVDGQAAVLLPGGDGLHVGPDLAFVIDSAAGENRVGAGVGFANGGLEGGLTQSSSGSGGWTS
jgi:hypothetical protein